MNNKTLHVAAFLLVIIGAINWGLVGLLDFNLVDALVGAGSTLSKVVYGLVAASAVWLLVQHKVDCKTCA